MSDWEQDRNFVEPVVRDINQPGATLLRLQVVLDGDGQESVSCEFLYEEPNRVFNVNLLRHAASLVEHAAERMATRDQP